MNALVRPTMGPVADATVWVDDHVIDAVPNLVAGGARQLAEAGVVVDTNAVDGVYHASAGLTGATGRFLRLLLPGNVHQYVALSFAGVVAIVALFMIF